MIRTASRTAAVLLAAALTLAPTLAAARNPRVPEGTELLIRFDQKLSSGANSTGDPFALSLADDVPLPDGPVLRAGYSGKGEVTYAKRRGHMGQAGKLNVRLNYLRIGDTRLRLRGDKGGDGKSSTGATIALTVIFGPLGLLKHGHDLEIEPGQTLTAYVDEGADLKLPLPPPPRDR